ncbi:MAG: divalent cation tolerance protein CutA [Rickettsiales bacterium]
MSFLLFYIPCNNYKEADKIAKILVKEKLAACVNIIPNPIYKSVFSQ